MEILLEQLRATRPIITLDDLKTGEEQNLGRGVSIQAFMNDDNRISFMRFTHHHDGKPCTKIIPIRQKQGRARRKKWKMPRWDGWGGGIYDGYWDIHLNDDRTISLSPSLLCSKHHVHGYFRAGRWMTGLDYFLREDDEVIEKKIAKAIEEAEEFGGGYQGAILALASRQFSVTK